MAEEMAQGFRWRGAGFCCPLENQLAYRKANRDSVTEVRFPLQNLRYLRLLEVPDGVSLDGQPIVVQSAYAEMEVYGRGFAPTATLISSISRLEARGATVPAVGFRGPVVEDLKNWSFWSVPLEESGQHPRRPWVYLVPGAAGVRGKGRQLCPKRTAGMAGAARGSGRGAPYGPLGRSGWSRTTGRPWHLSGAGGSRDG